MRAHKILYSSAKGKDYADYAENLGQDPLFRSSTSPLFYYNPDADLRISISMLISLLFLVINIPYSRSHTTFPCALVW